MSADFLQEATQFFTEEVSPLANQLDSDPELLRVAFQGLCNRQFMALKRPQEFGGPEQTGHEYRLFQELAARYSGALAFLMTQQQSAVSLITSSQNQALKARFLPFMHNGERTVGIGISQLRRSGVPMITATKCEGGYLLNGVVPWVTGLSFYQFYVIGASLASGEALFAIVPFEHEPEQGCRLSDVMQLAAMQSAQTVSATYHNYKVPDDHVLYIKSSDWATQNDQLNVILQGYFSLGCARAGLDILQKQSIQKPLPFLSECYIQLDAELESCRAEMARHQLSADGDDTEKKHQLRGWAIDLSMRCAHAAVISSSGAANQKSHPAQRVLREALVFSVTSQTSQIMNHSLKRLVQRS